jgi:thymidylate synthase
MSIIINSKNILDGWGKTCNHLLKNNKEDSHLLITIDDPTHIDQNWFKQHNPKALFPNKKSLSDVANTIFPMKTRKNSTSRPSFYKRYLKAHRRSRSKKNWGTYFLRLTNFGAKKENQLENTINCINKWQKDYKAAFYFHLSSPETDNPRPMGNPCWQYGELSINNGKIDFTVVYRNHDYFHMALGNFIGLSRLQQFICEETKKEQGVLVCHSIHAFFNVNIPAMNKLIKGV